MNWRTARTVAMVLLVVSCATVPEGPRPEPSLAPEGDHPTEPLPVPTSADPTGIENVPEAGSVGRPLPPYAESQPWLPPSGLDLDQWPFGWVLDEASARDLGVALRFWSDQKPLWREALAPDVQPAVRIRSLEQVYRTAGSADEALRSAWQLAAAYRGAGLGDLGRRWLDRAAELTSASRVALERSWDQGFRLGDWDGARTLWPAAGTWLDDGAARKARLLRQRLYLGVRSLVPVGADDYVSAFSLDRDDLWMATWNGAVVRVSLANDTTDLIVPATESVAPIKTLATTAWFLYAFQDKLLLRYSKVTGGTRAIPYPEGWTGLRVQGVVADGEESLWVAYLGQGLWHWNRGQWTLVDDQGGGPFLNTITADGQGGFWIGTKDRGLWSWREGRWSSVSAVGVRTVSNVSVVAPAPGGGRWFVGTWGEGTWLLDEGVLSPWSSEPDYVTAAVWTDQGPVWGALDVGLVRGSGSERSVLGPLDGLPAGGVSSLVSWSGRWIWGTNGQGWGWWTEYENPALLR